MQGEFAPMVMRRVVIQCRMARPEGLQASSDGVSIQFPVEIEHRRLDRCHACMLLTMACQKGQKEGHVGFQRAAGRIPEGLMIAVDEGVDDKWHMRGVRWF